MKLNQAEKIALKHLNDITSKRNLNTFFGVICAPIWAVPSCGESLKRKKDFHHNDCRCLPIAKDRTWNKVLEELVAELKYDQEKESNFAKLDEKHQEEFINWQIDKTKGLLNNARECLAQNFPVLFSLDKNDLPTVIQIPFIFVDPILLGDRLNVEIYRPGSYNKYPRTFSIYFNFFKEKNIILNKYEILDLEKFEIIKPIILDEAVKSGYLQKTYKHYRNAIKNALDEIEQVIYLDTHEFVAVENNYQEIIKKNLPVDPREHVVVSTSIQNGPS